MIDLLFKFSVTRKMDEKIHRMDVGYFLSEGEDVKLGYDNERDRVWFTNKRLVIMDVKGISGNKKQFRFFPYKKINSYSIETAGLLDYDSDFKIWLSGIGSFEIKFKKGLDIREVGKFLSDALD